VIFRAGELGAAWHILHGLADVPALDRPRQLIPLVIAALIAFLLPASQDLVAGLAARPKPVVPVALGVMMLALLFELGERDVYEFVYFQF
jgi:alginate O-acetyltransferase complex protein AlgI